jgi:hypothetical protein
MSPLGQTNRRGLSSRSDQPKRRQTAQRLGERLLQQKPQPCCFQQLAFMVPKAGQERTLQRRLGPRRKQSVLDRVDYDCGPNNNIREPWVRLTLFRNNTGCAWRLVELLEDCAIIAMPIHGAFASVTPDAAFRQVCRERIAGRRPSPVNAACKRKQHRPDAAFALLGCDLARL